MQSISPIRPALDLTARTRKLPDGMFLGCVEQKIVQGARSAVESYIAGTFPKESQAYAAAVRLMCTFRRSVLPSEPATARSAAGT